MSTRWRIFLAAVLLVVLFAGGSYLDWFPLRGLVSDDWETLSWPARIVDYFWHITLPILAMVIGGFAGLTMLTKNSFLDEIRKQYVVTARAKGLPERVVLLRHALKPALLPVISYMGPATAALITGSVVVERIYNLPGLGSYFVQGAMNRDYTLVMGIVVFYGLVIIVLNFIVDLLYAWLDPRISYDEAS